MPVTADLLDRKATNFVLWAPSAQPKSPPQLVIGQFQYGNPPTLGGNQTFTMTQAAGAPGLWEFPAAACGLADGNVYHYWFIVDDTNPDHVNNPLNRFTCADPAALSIDWRLLTPIQTAPYSPDDQQPASVVKFSNGQLVPSDPGGEEPTFENEPLPSTLPTNSQLVIYELPTAWTRLIGQNQKEQGVGTFQDVLAMIDSAAGGANFPELPVTQVGHSYLTDLGVNALELLPPADSFVKREWGYDTSHYFAPDAELGMPLADSWPTANSDLARLVNACHTAGIRFFVDSVMAFSTYEPYQYADYNDFYIQDPTEVPSDPDAMTSQRGDGGQQFRNGWGSTLWRYAKLVNNLYDPMTGATMSLYPGRQHMLTQMTRWMRDFHVDGWRLDSLENVASWDFIGAFKNQAYANWNQRWNDAGLGAGANDRFLVVGEELSLPTELITQGRVDALWNEAFQARSRAAVLGQNVDGEPTFEWTVRQMIDCRNISLHEGNFTSGAQVVNYVTKHDVEGYRHERLYNMLASAGLGEPDIAKRVKLAFACLLTAVGIPMFLAGEEFADQHDRFDSNGNVDDAGGKQVDPVNFSRLNDPFRKDIWTTVSWLIKLRVTAPALSVDDTQFIQVDFDDGKRVLAWQRGAPGQDPIVVVANFSDWGSDVQNPGSEYVLPNYPPTPPGRSWREVSQNRAVDPAWVGREPLYPWEAKVYALT
jgi:1,4-alpha-glucan branching enzyme